MYSANDYFKGIFGKTSAADCEVSIHDIKGDILEKLVAYCYTGRIEATDEDLSLLMAAATKFQFNELKIECSEADQPLDVNLSNCLTVWTSAGDDLQDLKAKAKTCVIDNFSIIADSDDFLKLSCEYVGELLETEQLNVDSEDDALKALVSWVSHDANVRKIVVRKLIKYIRVEGVTITVS